LIDRIITALMLVVAIIHLLPVTGVVGAERIVALYGVKIVDPNLEILMRHRAVLFGILGVFFAYAAFKPSLQPFAFVAALVSISSFFAIAFSVGGFNDAIGRVVIADVVAGVALISAIVLYWAKQTK
jgi:hypothetical protein